MNNSITLKEFRHPIWKIGTSVSALLTIVFSGAFWATADPFWEGILRLGAFICFALTVLGTLKLMNGSLQVTLEDAEEILLVIYQKKGKTIQEEQFDRESIQQIIPANPHENLVHSLLQPEAITFKINFNDSDRELLLFEFGGRPLFFAKSSQEKIENFLHKAGIKPVA